MFNFKYLMSLGGWFEFLKIFIDLELMRVKLCFDLYSWKVLFFVCLKDGREVYNGFCFEVIF